MIFRAEGKEREREKERSFSFFIVRGREHAKTERVVAGTSNSFLFILSIIIVSQFSVQTEEKRQVYCSFLFSWED
jgi:hypothetical protein